LKIIGIKIKIIDRIEQHFITLSPKPSEFPTVFLSLASECPTDAELHVRRFFNRRASPLFDSFPETVLLIPAEVISLLKAELRVLLLLGLHQWTPTILRKNHLVECKEN
jgi:hypothetical protein